MSGVLNLEMQKKGISALARRRIENGTMLGHHDVDERRANRSILTNME
jgi:hypothetical protein